ncbi:proton-conducting transporter transmembrane domain-containing protein [Halomonas alkalisoli]|uniref:proton-conducting transporter transmembrane domain-containing protein n=1 Tax=Halomonas alkalisoli TaxID=2907158 RepID=UPI001F3A2478|nr:proton-conducting transporter membrane subunit [Halomonas alkalisoli]MCE9684053.1 NADH-quinone oxidoreductase subunit N [Halomonas alkalisoli]
MMSAWALPLSVVVPLCLAIVAFLEGLSPRRQVLLGVPAILVSLGVASLHLLEHSALVLALGDWPAPLGIVWQLDAPGALMLGMTAIVAAAGSVALLADDETARDRHLWPLWWLLWGGLNALLLSQDLFNLYITLELVTLAGVGLVARSPQDPEGSAALRYLLASLLASLLFLLGVALLYGQTARLDMALLGATLTDNATSRLAAIALSLGLMIKAAMVPLHTWLPSAHARAQAPVSAMLSAVVVAATLFVLWRLWLGPLAALQSALGNWLAIVGTAALVWGGIQATLQSRLKLLIAWSTLSQSGYALLLLGLAGTASWPGAGSGGSTATEGALQILLAHGLAKAAMFIAAGAIVATYGHDRLSRLGGSAARLPLAWLAIALAGLSLLGAPPTGGFVGKWWLLSAAFAEGNGLIAAVVLLGTLITAASLWRLLDLALCPAPTAIQRLLPHPDAPLAGRLARLALGLALLAWLQGLGTLGLSNHAVGLGMNLDSLGLIFMLPALAVWPIALGATHAWRHAFPASRRLFSIMLVAAVAHLVTLVAGDLLTFYIGTAMLSLLGWAMVQHDGDRPARLAGIGYLAMMLLAEIAMLAGLALVSLTTTDLSFSALAVAEPPAMAITYLALGLGLKAGVLGLHAWLPLAHPVAPPMASAILSGLMIKVGVLGALRLLPEAEAAAGWGVPLLALGIIASLYAALRGVLHDHNKAVLAWSSVSQMGLITALLGLVILAEAPAEALTALLLVVTVHTLAKGSLFLGAGMANRTRGRVRQRVVAAMLLPALALAGMPPLGGVLVKASVETAMSDSGLPTWPIILSGVATALLMLRFFWLLLMRPEPSHHLLVIPRWLWWAWLGLGLLAALAPWGWQWVAPVTANMEKTLIAGLLSPLIAIALAGMVLPARRLHRTLASRLESWRVYRQRQGRRRARQLRILAWRFRRAEAWLMPWPAFGIALGLMTLGMGLASLVTS